MKTSDLLLDIFQSLVYLGAVIAALSVLLGTGW